MRDDLSSFFLSLWPPWMNLAAREMSVCEEKGGELCDCPQVPWYVKTYVCVCVCVCVCMVRKRRPNDSDSLKRFGSYQRNYKQRKCHWAPFGTPPSTNHGEGWLDRGESAGSMPRNSSSESRGDVQSLHHSWLLLFSLVFALAFLKSCISWQVS